MTAQRIGAAGCCAVLVFAKAPVAGVAKTRLAPALGPAGAARLARRMLRHAVAQARAAALGPVQLWCAPDAAHPEFARLARDRDVSLHVQRGADLGERMADAMREALAAQPAALLIGTDAPAIDSGYLRRAAAALRDADVVLAPALDGGYALIGLRRPAALEAFAGIDWGTRRVLEQTRARLRALPRAHVELESVADIDEPGDLRHLPAGWQPRTG
ncbi:MAG TPA: TIGR04282 family arsenosugar biosynthesis glycosyltransferase [Burkholderiaceae bacterium]|nr:TIGR04282 family arsenosugar biosynthesis glycosyltransferase [Burkholderiaceae bacterium]